MSLRGMLRKTNPATQNYAESSGYYERVPIRVDEWTLVENEEGRIVFETTCKQFCENGPKTVVTISDDDAGWSVTCSQGCYGWSITTSVDLHDERLARRRAMWHAAQHMAGRELSWKERFSLSYQVHHEDDADLFKDDAFFKNGNAVTNDPFGEFLEDK